MTFGYEEGSSAQSNGCENSPAGGAVNYRTQLPLHVRYKGAQLAYAIAYLHRHRDVRLVSLMIGPNDYFVCVATTSDGCASSAEQHAVLAKIAANVRRILSAVRKNGHYKGQLAIMKAIRL